VTYGGQFICYANLEYLQEFSTEWIICVAKRWARGLFKLQARDEYYFVIVKASQTKTFAIANHRTCDYPIYLDTTISYIYITCYFAVIWQV
jgi:hypothetical protein